MPRAKDKAPTREDMLRAEQEVGENLPESFVGLDNEDVRNVVRHPAPPKRGEKPPH